MPTVEQLYRFPIKGFPAQALQRARVRAGSGIDGDRALAFSNGTAPVDEGEWSPWDSFTALKNDVSLQGWHLDADTDRAGMTTVSLTAPDGASARVGTHAADDRTVAEELLGQRLAAQGPHPRRLVHGGQGMFDSRPSGISIINPASIALLARAAGVDLDPRRFRGNVLVGGLDAGAEYDWVGRIVTIGGVRLWIRSAIERCSATRVNPVTGAVDVNVPHLLATAMGHQHCGVYGVVLDGGDLSVGDEIFLDDRVAGAPRELPADVWKPRTSARMASVVDVKILDADGSAPVARIRLRDPQGWMEALYCPGQNLRLHLVVDGLPVWRTYTITRVRGQQVELMVALGGAVSRHLAELRRGDGVVISGPFGRLTSDTLGQRRTAAVVGGIGATPALALAGALPGMPVLHVERPVEASEVHQELASAPGLGPVSRWSTMAHGRPGVEDVAAWLQEQAADEEIDVIACGPRGFGATVRDAADRAGVVDTVHEEVFASPVDLYLVPEPDLAPAKVSIEGEDATITWTPTSGYLIDALDAAGVRTQSNCRGGSCGSCVMRLLEGEVTYPVEPAAGVSEDEVVTCSAFPVGDVRLAR